MADPRFRLALRSEGNTFTDARKADTMLIHSPSECWPTLPRYLWAPEYYDLDYSARLKLSSVPENLRLGLLTVPMAWGVIIRQPLFQFYNVRLASYPVLIFADAKLDQCYRQPARIISGPQVSHDRCLLASERVRDLEGWWISWDEASMV